MTQKYYMTRVFDFLEQLSRNNDREWFKAHKPEFDELRALWLNDLDRLISLVAQWMPSVAMQSARQAAYRIYRDTRFSPDKTPYKTYFSAAISPRGREKDYAGFYLHQDIDSGEAGLYGGIWCPPAPVLKKLRHAIVDNIEEWEEIMNSPGICQNYELLTFNALKTIRRPPGCACATTASLRVQGASFSKTRRGPRRAPNCCSHWLRLLNFSIIVSTSNGYRNRTQVFGR